MIINTEYDLSRPLQTAIHAKSPYVGVPMPGHAPLIFKRSILAGVLQGVKPIYIEVNTLENGLRVLTVEGTAGRNTRTRCRLFSLTRNAFRNPCWEPAKAMDKWKPTMAPKAARKAPKQTKFDKAILTLEKKLAKLGERPHLSNPVTITGYRSQDHDSCLKWYSQKSLRGQVGALGKMTRAGNLTSHEFYAAMDKLPGIGEVVRYSELNTRQKESIQGDIRSRLGRNGFFDYANPKVLWTFMPALKVWHGSKPYGLRPLVDNGDCPRWGVKRYEPVLQWLRERQEILLAIASIREMQTTPIAPVEPLAPTFEEFIQQMAA